MKFYPFRVGSTGAYGPVTERIKLHCFFAKTIGTVPVFVGSVPFLLCRVNAPLSSSFQENGQAPTLAQGGYLYIYIYIYIHPFTKTLLFQKYIPHICITVEKRLKQGGHITSVIPLWPSLSVFYMYVFSDVDKKDTSAEKA